INPRVFERLEETARSHEIAVQVRGAPRATGTDANAIQLARDGVAAGLIGLPNRYMHSPVEVVATADLERAARLLAEFCATVPADADWTPRPPGVAKSIPRQEFRRIDLYNGRAGRQDGCSAFSALRSGGGDCRSP